MTRETIKTVTTNGKDPSVTFHNDGTIGLWTGKMGGPLGTREDATNVLNVLQRALRDDHKETITHDVPDSDMKTVLMVDGGQGHRGTLITRIDEINEYVFASLADNTCTRWERCVLVQLGQCPDDLIEGGECAHNWWEYCLPGHRALACNLDTDDLDAVTGTIMIGMDVDAELSTDLGEVLWDSHQGK